jgi:hypothetical protein
MPFNVIIDTFPQLTQVTFNTVQTVPSARAAVRLELPLQTYLRPDQPQQPSEQRRRDHNERHEVGGAHGDSGAAGGMKSVPSKV